jgi:hypothetical protein
MATTQKDTTAGAKSADVDGDQAQDAKPSAQAQQAAELSGSAADVRRRKRAALAAELAEIDRADQAEGVNTPPDKRLTLAGGEVVETSGAVPTHHFDSDGVLRRVLDFEPITD